MTKATIEAEDGSSTVGRSFYEETMTGFEDTCELLGLDERIRMELRQPHYELIFHITIDMTFLVLALVLPAACAGPAAPPRAGEWRLAKLRQLTFDGTNQYTLYKNGIAGSPTTVTEGTSAVTAVEIGCTYGLYGFLTGQVTDCRIYTTCLTPEAVWQMYAPESRWDLYWVPSPKTYFDWAVGLQPGLGSILLDGLLPTSTTAGGAEVWQYGRPISDIAAGTWTPSSGSDLYAMVDETSPSDSDYIISAATPADDTAVLGLGPMGTPGAGTVTLSVRVP